MSKAQGATATAVLRAVREGNRAQLIVEIERGLEPRILDYVEEWLHLTKAQVASLVGLSSKTLGRKAEQKTPLDLQTSERLARILRLAERASEVIGRPDGIAWLQEPNSALDGRTPLVHAATDLGAQDVEDLLGRIEHGVFS